MAVMAEDERGKDPEIGTMALLMAHDLRNMFSVLSGLLILLERRNETRYLELMKKQLDFCEQIVASFVRFVQEGGPARRTVVVEPMIQGLVESMPVPENIRLQMPDGLPGSLMGDPGQVRQILWNVLANAVDACGLRSSEIFVRTREAAGFVCIEIEDTAGGISPEIRERLMEKGVTTKTAGLGLGLYLSRRLAEANGGRLECESVEGTGT
ncbi:MAG TPA: HAMP domain-containing sensor histidine kinase, partial [Acidobacteriota bacterium]|nr:HAMP domain-containing sensor histidine kinase [Acidobacteriota bacterium]